MQNSFEETKKSTQRKLPRDKGIIKHHPLSHLSKQTLLKLKVKALLFIKDKFKHLVGCSSVRSSSLKSPQRVFRKENAKYQEKWKSDSWLEFDICF